MDQSFNKKRKVDELEDSEKNGEKILKNRELIYQTTYSLNKSKSKLIGVGLEYENWNVGVKLISSKGIEINLTEKEWNVIINYKTSIEKYFDESDTHGIFIPIYTAFGLAIEAASFDGNLLLKISKDNFWMYFGKSSFTYLFSRVQLIQVRIINLKNLNFRKYFEETIYSYVQLGGDILSNIRYITQPNDPNFSSENLYCLNEILSIYPNVISEAVNKTFY